MKKFSELMSGQNLLPIIQADTVYNGVAIAGAMLQAGLKVVEVVLRSDASLEALKAIKKAHPNLIVGAGTVLDSEILAQAIGAGADYIVTPCVTPTLLEALKNCGVPAIPGVSNCSDIALARDAGFREVKLFPASLSGGVAFLRAVSSVYQDMRFCPTGGVNQDNKDEFLALANVVAVGGTWVVQKEWVVNQDWESITEACQAANK
ncbi:bifunctional 4-hydroxy-2-oxoglutarate aldolase/2-dehydro-3-deoxy-phosphogluconate aldolase [Echinimonas agarilytica]|uniref:Bifunctional 4-hydroxy-2-oxoglutarate aldolase/2-dehydro-3-deoxy-phosphogluconate aldolase n=1 Tax=Echinimonas agarilytica TaxID=1215918 RepID=A0AA42B839_9GAMM|nr:bifunctional 4-hydroxy-2-oxoglutarate aldolase/2-dehydro-3-deoxy-phosphogluconate aldolase [Echinimonas agarilytica]MCM2680740.1 bifunctional 4-hydroxy-2-oxoglutarate aldolase/2-dehydro-3-deoxy-phosphogluconate aldolase [Echinimonas agarilytica]